MRALALLLLVACGAPELERPPKDYGEPCCTCWESWTGGCTAMRLSKVRAFACEARAPRPPLCRSELAALRDAGLEPDAGVTAELEP